MRKFGLLALIICLIMAFAPGTSAQEYQPQETYVKVYLEGELLEDRLVVENHAMMMYTPFLEDNAPDGGREEEEK